MTKKNNSSKFILGFVIAVLVPLSFYFIAKVQKKDQLDMPGYYIAEGVDTVSEDGETYYDTTFHKVADLRLVNQFGDTVSLNGDLGDKVLLVNFFFTTCPTVCTKLTGNLVYYMQTAFRKNDTTLHMVSISVDPQRDSFPALRAYADRYKADHDHWWFLTGDRDSIYNYAYNELHVVMGKSDEGAEAFVHTQKVVLLDKDRHIRGYYDGLDTADLARCANDIGLLSMEKKHKRRH